MLFSSPEFLFLFFPLVILIYFLVPKKVKNLILLLSSLAFYTWGEQELVVLIILSALIDYSCGLIIAKGWRKLGVISSIVFNLGILFYFKYSNFVYTNLANLLESYDYTSDNAQYFANIMLPIGISFYTFQTMSYTLDVYKGNVKATKNFIDFATYVMLFPQLIAGPIVRYSHIELELKDRKTSLKNFSIGIERFIIGLAKKVIIANNCGILVDGIFNLPTSEMSSLIGWVGIFAFGIQIYYDFSGYSDMAIGLGKMFGFNFPENFNYPYTSKSIQEFWKRWHITLSTWFRDYVYIPLGLKSNSKKYRMLILMFVFFLTGFWHGANWNFIVWGLIHGLFIIFERLGLIKYLQKIHVSLTNIYAMFVVFVTFPFFRCSNLTEALNYIANLFTFSNATNYDYLSFYLSKEVGFILLIGTIFCFPIYLYIDNKIKKQLSLSKQNIVYNLKSFCLLVLLLINYMYISKGNYSPFIYFNF